MVAAVALPMKPRMLWPGIVVIAATYVYVATWPAAFVYIGTSDVAPRAISPFEYAPIAIALVLCLGLAPRLDDWDRYGAPRTRTLALVNAGAVVVAPLAVFFTSLPLYPADGVPPASALIPLASNIAVAALLAVIVVGLLGPLLGTLAWAASIYCVMLWQSTAPEALAWGPFTMYVTANGEPDTATRWGWILGCALAAFAVVWTRRSVPLRITVRSPEER